MIPRLSNRTARSRAVRGNTGQPRLESLAAEFALLAQRRSRAIQQIAILDQQRSAAAASFAKLEKRIAWLMQRMDEVNPTLRDPAAAARSAEPSVADPAQGLPPAMAERAANALAAIGREWAASQSAYNDRSGRTKRT